MHDWDNRIRELRRLFKCQDEAVDRLRNLQLEAGVERPERHEAEISHWRGNVSLYQNYIHKELEDFLRYPPHLLIDGKELTEFHRLAPYEKSVFIMTKYPPAKAKSGDAVLLERIIEAVCNAVRSCDYVPRMARDKDHAPMLWKNVEFYLAGCIAGIAIIEDKYCPELNPNVALEWGWMRAMNKRVLCLVESSFTHLRADLDGFTRKEFEWNNPEPGIKDAVESWLPL